MHTKPVIAILIDILITTAIVEKDGKMKVKDTLGIAVPRRSDLFNIRFSRLGGRCTKEHPDTTTMDENSVRIKAAIYRGYNH